MLGRLLRHPWLRPLKAAVRDLAWRVKGRRIANPPLPPDVESVLFICLGNICRSPFAEVIAQERLRARGRALPRVSSAGIHTRQAAAPPDDARAAAAAYGVSLETHRPRQLTAEMMEAHDLVVVMEHAQMAQLHATFPQFRERVFLLPLFDAGAAGRARFVIDDPFAQSRAVFDACYRRIDRTVSTLLTAIAAGPAR